MIKKLIQRCFAVLILLVLLLGLAKTIFRPKEINTYENRYANQVQAFTVSGFLDSSFQNAFEDALMDQVTGAQTLKQAHHKLDSAYLQQLMDPFFAAYPHRYIHHLGAEIFDGDYMTYAPKSLSDAEEALAVRAENLNAVFAAHPDVDFYLYLVERDTNVNFETGEKEPFYETLTGLLKLDKDRMARFRIDSFDEYAPRFFRTDHHWNHLGSYEGYCQLLTLLGCEDAPLAPQEEVTLPLPYSGAKAASTGALALSEPFTVYHFDFPDMAVTVNGEAAEDYGRQDEFFNGTAHKPGYGEFYGPDAGEVVFETNRPDRENLLVLGDSFDNAVLKLLASHFDRTYAVDLRNYKALVGEDFSLSRYLRDNAIDKVLLMGSDNYFTLEDFLLEN